MHDENGNAFWKTCENCPTSFQVEEKKGRLGTPVVRTYGNIQGEMEVCVAIDNSENLPQVIFPRSGYEDVASGVGSDRRNKSTEGKATGSDRTSRSKKIH